MKILYAGDSPVGGPANYLLGILKHLRAQYVHIPPSVPLEERWLGMAYDVFILSDYSRKKLSPRMERMLLSRVQGGAGLAMIGGWGSFSGPFGQWKGSLIEKALPVICRNCDDRVNFPGGALILPENPHFMLQGVSFSQPPVICGLNRVQPKKDSTVLLAAKKILTKPRKGSPAVSLSLGDEYPLLVIANGSSRRIAAFTTDAAPHWCGGLVDWGRKTVRLHVKDDIWVEVGDSYVRFFCNFFKWLAGGRA